MRRKRKGMKGEAIIIQTYMTFLLIIENLIKSIESLIFYKTPLNRENKKLPVADRNHIIFY